MTTALDSARHLIRLGYDPTDPEESDFLCPLRVQKLLYYVQGWSLALRNRPMFSEHIEAWKFGPVVPEVYQRLKPFGFQIVTPGDAGPPDNLPLSDQTFIDAVWSQYKSFSATKLREMTHNEPPWLDARRGLPADARSSNVITLESLRAHFQRLANQFKGSGPLAELDLNDVWEAEEEMLRGGGQSFRDIVAEMSGS